MKPSSSSPSPQARTLNIVGGGKVARTLGRLWNQHGTSFIVQDVLSRSLASAEAAVAFIGSGRAIADHDELRPADIWLIGTNDDQILAVAHQLVQENRLLPGAIVFHCSGAQPSSELQSIIGTACYAASVHPIRSFASPGQVAQSFTGTYCGVEGNEQALAVLIEAFTAIGAHPVQLDPRHKTIYHSAAVFACNYLVTLMDVAKQTYEKAGVPEDMALRMMEPLVKETMDNVFRHGPENALTGPIARGDLATVLTQYRAVRAWNTRFGRLYKMLGKLTNDLRRRSGRAG